MLDDSDKILQQNLPLLVCDDSSSDVAKYVRTAGLNCIQVAITKILGKMVFTSKSSTFTSHG